MVTFSQRLKELLEKKDLTQAELSRLSGVNKSSLSRYLKGDWKAKQDTVYAIAKATSINEAWLMGYDVPMNKPLNQKVFYGFEPMPEMDAVPLVGNIACGNPITAEANVEDTVSIPSVWHADFTLRCRGASMEPRIQNGDLVAIRKQPAVENGEIAAVRIGDEATLKHVYSYPNYIELRPENPAFASIIKIGPDMNDVHIEGKAVGLCRGL